LGQYEEGEEVLWWGFSSTTTNVGVLSNDMFLGKEGDRTMFNISISSGVNIAPYSAVVGEAEVLRIFAKIGQRIGEDAMVTSDGVPDSEGGLRKELDKLYKSRDYWTNEDTQKRVSSLNKALVQKTGKPNEAA
ncbi:MAG: hypothetical protein HOH66_03145, partial [Rhodospirillaceae bacterium]|nr:hypothetical protein [Rhodospirillaceae bacterium]